MHRPTRPRRGSRLPRRSAPRGRERDGAAGAQVRRKGSSLACTHASLFATSYPRPRCWDGLCVCSQRNSGGWIPSSSLGIRHDGAATCLFAPHRRLLGLPARAPPCSLRSERSCSLAAQRNAPASFATAAASPLEYHVRAIGTMFQLVSAVLGRRWGGPRPAGPAMGRNHSRRCSGGTS